MKLMSEHAEGYLDFYLKELCQELLDWSNTTILVKGKVRYFANQLNCPVYDQLKIAESLIKHKALEYVANVST